MTVLTGLLILAAVLIAAALTVLGAIASAAEIFPPWFGDGVVNASHSAPQPQFLRGGRSEATRTRA